MAPTSLKLTGSRDDLMAQMRDLYPAWEGTDAEAREYVGPVNKKEVWPEQAAAIAYLASQYDRPSATILEIGANRGYTATIMRLAAPRASVTTLEPNRERRRETRKNVATLGVSVRPETSVAWLPIVNAQALRYDLIFVDGDHARVALDLPFWNYLKRGGLFLHHDYSHPDSARPCPPVYDALNDFAVRMEREPDVLVQDDTGVGLWGMYRRKVSEVWEVDAPTQDEPEVTTEYWFRCPQCNELKVADADQAEGRVSILCDCGFHETGKVRPLIPTTTPTKPEDAPSKLEVAG